MIETERCILKEMAFSDNQYWFLFMSNEVILKYLPDRIMSLGEMSNIIKWLIQNYDLNAADIIRLTLAIHLKNNSSIPIGWVTFGELPENDQLKEIGYAIHPDYWNKGFATEAVHQFIKYIHENVYNLDLYATVDIKNTASIKVLNKVGMKKLSNPKDHIRNNIQNHDLYVYKNGRKLAG